MITRLDTLALKVARAQLVITSAILYCLVIVARRYCRYLKTIDQLETQWMGTVMMSQCDDFPGPIRQQLLVTGYWTLFIFSYSLWADLIKPVVEGLV